jgi:predicted phosphodiesterase
MRMSTLPSYATACVMVVGDTHARIDDWDNVILPHAHYFGIRVIIVTGDIDNTDGGDLEFIDNLSAHAAGYGVTIILVDGNHDRHNFLRYMMKGRYNRFCKLRSNIWYAPRGHRWTWHGVTFVAAGGAYSIDQEQQERHGIYQPREILSGSDVLRCTKGGHADIVVAHDCPEEIDLATEHMGRRVWTRGDSPQTNINRRLLSEVVAGTTATNVVHGHYHLAYASDYTSGAGQLVHVIGLGANAETGSMVLLSLHSGTPVFEVIR